MIRSALVFLAMVGSAWAGPTLTFILDTDGCSGAGCAGGPPYGTITVTQGGDGTANNGIVDVKLVLEPGIKFVGNPPSFGFNLIGNPTITLNSITTDWTLTSTSAGSNMFSAFGNFDYSLNCVPCGSGASHPQPGPLNFEIAATSLDTTSFKELSDKSAYFSADVQGTNGGTGNVGSKGTPKETTTTTPEPSSIALFGTTAGAFMFMLWSRRRKLNSQA